MSPPDAEMKAPRERRLDADPFPVLVHEISSDDGFPGDTGSASNVDGSLNRVAQHTIRSVLGWRHREGDAKGFTAALGKAFTLKEVEGHTEWEWKPQAFTLQADLGEITGAQASIHNQASLLLEQAIKLLDGLTPLRPAADLEDTEAVRSIIRAELRAFIDELATRGGPRVKRADLLLYQLLGENPGEQAFQARGQLRTLRKRFGLTPKRVNTIEEEQNLTNYLIMVDYILSVDSAWKSKRSFFDHSSGNPFLGTTLVKLSQELEVIVESVRESYAVMDSVFFGASERETVLLKLPNEIPITVSELLGWVESFASTEGPELLRSSGKDGAAAFWRTAFTLRELVESTVDLAESESEDLPLGLRTHRVRAALISLRDHLGAAEDLANQVRTRDKNDQSGKPDGDTMDFDDADDEEEASQWAAGGRTADGRRISAPESSGKIETDKPANSTTHYSYWAEHFPELKDKVVVEKWASPKEVRRRDGRIVIPLDTKYTSIPHAALFCKGERVGKFMPSDKDASKPSSIYFEIASLPTANCDLLYVADGQAFEVQNAVTFKN